MSASDIASTNLNFFGPCEQGINLLAIHGALNIYSYRDGLDLCRRRPTSETMQGALDALNILNSDIGYWLDNRKTRTLNEVPFMDEQGEMQFLRRTLLTGSQKFNERFSQTLPMKMLELFNSYIQKVQKLYVIGYSFGDMHINSVIREWIESRPDRSIVIVDPFCKDIPIQFSHLSLEIDIVRLTASQFFSGFRSEPLTSAQSVEQIVRSMYRPISEKAAAIKW